MAEEGNHSVASFFSGDARISTLSFVGYLGGAIAADILLCDWMPGAGTMFVMLCRGMYFLNGYKTDKMMTTTMANAIAGFIPIVADFTSIIFVVSTFSINRAETAAGTATASIAGKKLAEASAARSVGQGLKGMGGSAAAGASRAANENQQGGESGRSSNSATRPTTATDKNIGLQNTGGGNARTPGQEDRRSISIGGRKNIDGVRPQEKPYVPTQPAFREPQAANDNAPSRDAYREAA